MVRAILNTSFVYNGDKKDYYVQMKRRRFPWWIILLLLIPLFIWLNKINPIQDLPEPEHQPDVWQEGEPLPEPVPGCGVHFSGRHLSDGTDVGFGTIFQMDEYSSYVGAGLYPSCQLAFPLGSFHGIAIDKGTRLIMYKEPDFKGEKILDVTGPLLVNCSACTFRFEPAMIKFFSSELQGLFPQWKRKLESDFYGEMYLYDWYNGSCKIICEPCQEESNSNNDK